MTTYSKETALYDTGAIATDITEAGTKATNYIEVDGDGIKVHKTSDPDNYVRINSDGMDISNDDATVAHFANDGIYLATKDGQKVFTVDSEASPTTQTIVVKFGRETRTIESGDTKVFNVNRIKVADDGEPLSLQIQRGTTTPVKATVTKGTPIDNLEFGDRSVYLTYDGDVEFTIDNQSSYDYNLNRITFTKTWYEILEIIRGNALIDGDTTISDSLDVYGDINLNGDVYIDETPVSNGSWYLETYKQLWVNTSPTSNFVAQTILANNTGLAECDEIRIYYRHSTTDDRIYCATGDIGTKVPLNVQGMEYNRTGGRIATVNSTGIAFGAASYNTNSNNTYAVPTKIIGVKHA